jgi:hypothetical protein
MTVGSVSPTTLNYGIKVEAVSGTPEVAPGVYVLLGAESRPKNNKGSGQRQVYGTPDPVLPWRKPETTDLSLPFLPLVEDNGLGELLLAHFGSDVIGSQYGSTGAYPHVFTRAAPFKTVTIWVHDGIQDKKIRMMAPDAFNLTVKRDDGDVQPVFDMKGADMYNASDFGNAQYLDLGAAQTKALNALQARLEWGQPGANIRESWEQIKFASKLNTVFGVNSKDGLHIAGSGSPQYVTSSKIDTTIDLDFIDIDGEEMQRWYEGVDTDPTATTQHDNAGLIDYQFTLFGSIIGAMAFPWGEADINNIGTTTIIVAGTYLGGATALTMYEIKLAQGTPDTYSYRSCIGGKWSAWSAVELILSGGFKLALDTGTAVDIVFAYGAADTGAKIATAIQAAIQAKAGDYTAMTCAFGGGNYTITHASKQPVVTDAARNNLAAVLKLGVLNGGTETGFTSVSDGGVITLATQPNDLADGITVLFSSATLGAALDRYYVYSHMLRFLRVKSVNNMIESVVDSGGRDFKKSTLSAYHTSGTGGTKPKVTVVCDKASAYS